MNPLFFYCQCICRLQDQITVQTHEHAPLQVNFELNTCQTDIQSTSRDQDGSTCPNSSAIGNLIDRDLEEQWKQFEQEYQLILEEKEDNLFNESFLSLLNSPYPLTIRSQASGAIHNNIMTLTNNLPIKTNTANPRAITGCNQQSRDLTPIYKETAISKKKYRKNNESKALRKWKQWIWIDDQKNELIEVRDIYKKKKKPYDEFCTVLANTKK